MMDSRARFTMSTEGAPVHIAHSDYARANAPSLGFLWVFRRKVARSRHGECMTYRWLSQIGSDLREKERNPKLGAFARASGLWTGGEKACETARTLSALANRARRVIRPGPRPQAPLALPTPSVAADAGSRMSDRCRCRVRMPRSLPKLDRC